MRSIRRALTRFAGVAGSRRMRQDDRMEQEFREHIDLQTSDYIRAGIPPEEARRKAILKFGPVEALKEEFRDQRGMPALERLMKDLRHALRTLTHEPGFAILTTLMLGIGLAGAITVFSLVNGILLKPLPYHDPDRLAALWEINPEFTDAFTFRLVSAYEFIEWRKECRSIESMALIQGIAANVTGLGEPQRVDGAAVSPSFFHVLGVNPALGRAFADEEEQESKRLVAVLTDHFWRRNLNADPRILGKTIRVNGRTHMIIGVLGPEYRHPLTDASTTQVELFIPKVFDRIDLYERLGRFNYGAIARLKPNVSHRQVVAELESVQRRIGREQGVDTKLHAAVAPLTDAISGGARRELYLLMAAVGVLVLIICVNLANLLFARGERRIREFGVRAALGAGRFRLAMHSLAEAVILATAGGVLASGLAWAAIKIISNTNGLGIPRLNEVSLDARVLFFGVTLTALTIVVFGLLPAWRASRSDPQTALQCGGRGFADSTGGRKIRSSLVACEVGLCLPLLVLAGLLINSFVRLVAADKGFTAPAVMAADIRLSGERYREEADIDRFYRRLFMRLESTPGVNAAAVCSKLPLQGESWVSMTSAIENAPDEMWTRTNIRFISADYFRTMGIPIRSGRTLSDNDRGRSVSIISARLGELLWPGLNPVGRKFSLGNHRWLTVIGVVGDVRADPDKSPAPIMYRPYWDWMPHSTVLVARAAGDPRSIRGALRAAIRESDPEIPIPEMRTMAEVLDERVVTRKFEMILAGAFALIALIVATLGIYAVVSYSVSRRTAEIGLRSALGAQARNTYRLILGQGLAPVAIGLLIGSVCALVGARELAGILYEVRPNDATTMIVAVLILLAVAAAACLVPARRAARIDPAISLKHE